MKVLLQYDNFIRDYRGLLLLKALLEELGYKLCLCATWNNPLKFAKLFEPEIIFTHHAGDINIDHQRTFEAVMR